MKIGKPDTTTLALITILLLIFGVTFGAIFYFLSKPTREAEQRLPIYQPNDVNPELVDSTVQYIRKYHTIADFKLINQNGDTITQHDYDGKIYVADFFFTTCPSICPIMTHNIVYLQDIFKTDDHVKFLSHSVTPEIDSVPQLKKYALQKGVIDSKWNLVTGDKKQIYSLARKSYFAAENDGDGGPYDMVHTENFVLVDAEKRIRGFYNGTDQQDIERLAEDIRKLENELFEKN